MKKRQMLIGISALIFLFSFNIAFAYNVAYIVSNAPAAKQKYIDVLHEIGFNVTVVKGSDIGAINLSEYDFMLINNEAFQNYNSIPVNNHSALILNKYYIDDWHWVRYVSQKVSSQPIKGYANNPSEFITDGISGNIKLYTHASYNGAGIPVYYLSRYVKAPGLKTIVSKGNSTYEKNDAIIATAIPGTKLRDGYYSNTKSVFFGITESNFWTNETEKLFRRSALWLVTDMTPPAINNIVVFNITNESAVIKWETDDKSNSTLNYGTTIGLGNIKEDTNYLNSHAIYLTGLQEKTQYYYKVKSCNKFGYCSESGVFNFSTKDLTPPNILSVLVAGLTNLSVNISITTSEDSYSAIYYGILSLQYRTATSELSDKADFYIDGLNEKSAYSYLAEACDKDGNCRNSSLYGFTTLDITPPKAPNSIILEVMENNLIKVKWNFLDSGDISRYNIYITDNLNSFDFENPNASTNLTEYIDNGAALSKRRYYAVRAEDKAGNEEKNRNYVAKFDLSLEIGYNLVSIPLTPFDNDINEVMHQSSLYAPISEIKRFDALSQELQTAVYNKLSNSWDIADFTQLDVLNGCFFKSDKRVSFTIVGYPHPQISIAMVKGMNLVGLTFVGDKSLGDAIAQSPFDYNITEVASRNSDGSYDIAAYYPALGSWFNGFDVKPSLGYWVKANRDFSLTIES